ncbi:MAG: hypothetical protein R3B06_01695 [Kofleriaceae bacterium]
MLALALMLAAAGVGAGVVRRLGWSLTRLERWALIGAIALTVTPWVTYLLARLVGLGPALPLAAVALAAGGWALGRGTASAPAPDLPGTSALSWGALAALLALAFHGHMFHDEGGALFTGGSSYGDLALHATLANHFADGATAPTSPLVAGAPLTYPFLGDYLVGALMRGGWSMPVAFTVTGWLSAMIGLALLQAVALRMFRTTAAATIAVWLVVLSGSAAGLWYAGHDLAAGGLPGELSALPSYAHDPRRGLLWSNLVADFLLPQRALLAALPATWAAVWAIRAGVDDDTPRSPLVAAALVGALPLVHVHSFLVAAGLLALATAWQIVRVRGAARTWGPALALALVLAAPQLVWQFGGSWHQHFGRWRLGWLAPHGQVAWFWVCSWGPVALLAPVVTYLTLRRGSSFARALVVAALALFAASNLYQFQPHDWDNMKFLVYAFMFTAVATAGVLARWLERGGMAQVGVAVLVVGATASGALTLARELDLHVQLASPQDRALARQVQRLVPVDGRVLTSDQHNHVVPMLAGRAVAMGYRGWLWTYGIDYAPLEREVRAAFAGRGDVAARLRRLHVTHVFIGPGEVRDFGADAAWYRAHYPRVLATAGVELFDVRRPLAPRTAAR